MIINQEYLKVYSPLPKNYQMDEIINYVSVAEKIWIRPILGDELFDEIQEQIDDDNLSEENATLLTDGGVWQLLGFATALEAVPLVWAHVSEVSITKGHSDNSDALSLKELSHVEQHLRNQVEVLKENVIKFLNEHCDSYELFATSSCCSCSCCGQNIGLAKPNPNAQIYSPRKRNTDIK